MKTNHYWALLRFEMIALIFVLSLFMAFLSIFAASTDSAIPFLALGPASILFSYFFCFSDLRSGFARSSKAYVRPLEFLFARAISRNSLYWARMTWYGFTAMFPFLCFGIHSLFQPGRMVSFAEDLPGGDAVRAFYLDHFPGAIVQGSSIMLPHAQTELAMIILFFGLVVAATYQAVLLGTLRFRWCQWLMPVMLGVAPIYIPLIFMLYFRHFRHGARLHSGHNHLPPWDHALGWMIQHSVPLLLGGTVIIGFALWFGLRRFVRQEVQS